MALVYASVSRRKSPRTRINAVFSMPSFIAIASAVLKPMPRISRTSRSGSRTDLDGVRAIRLEYPHRSHGTGTVPMQKDHDFPHDDFEHFLAKGANEFLGVDRSYASRIMPDERYFSTE